MFKTIPEALDTFQELKAGLPDPLQAEVIIAPPFTALSALARVIQDGPVRLAAQNVHWAEDGAFTGEISTRMLVDVGCTYCLIGHSERRHVFGETDNQVHQKFAACLKAGLRPVLCLGETLEEREEGRIESVIERQLLKAVEGVLPEAMARGVVAYEPVWAIGTGRSATPAQAQEVHAFIRGLLQTRFNKTLALETRIVYGGSVTPDNIRDLRSQTDIDGALVGGASLKADKFLALIKEVNQ
jgi:triosephosphate isomerase